MSLVPSSLLTLAAAAMAGLALACTPLVAAAGQTPDLDWMSGHWTSTGGDPVIEEIWTNGDGGLLLGVNRTQVEGRAVGFEFLRIEIGEEQTRYCAQPGGRSAACFTLTEHGDSHARFENAEHDFPQVIEYSRDGDRLSALISDLSGEQAMQFDWQRAPE
ncbi:DUF6265 family protein [uncultured Maricaulis sp.]|uniref:DUF6265 family protein n=1 Tax=uncultured Maricaulis sp. TaxID=174710 RepID=UPI00260BBB3C|nr:DUF6265 family protein [uncultured Maricaulis sp.]